LVSINALGVSVGSRKFSSPPNFLLKSKVYVSTDKPVKAIALSNFNNYEKEDQKVLKDKVNVVFGSSDRTLDDITVKKIIILFNESLTFNLSNDDCVIIPGV